MSDSLKRKLKQIIKKTRPYSVEERLRKPAYRRQTGGSVAGMSKQLPSLIESGQALIESGQSRQHDSDAKSHG